MVKLTIIGIALALGAGCAKAVDDVMSDAARRAHWETRYVPSRGESMAAAYADLIGKLNNGGVSVELVAPEQMRPFGITNIEQRAIGLRADLPLDARFEVLAHEAGHLLQSPALTPAEAQVFAELVGVEVQLYYGSRTARETAAAYLPPFKQAFGNVSLLRDDIHRAARIILGQEPWPWSVEKF